MIIEDFIDERWPKWRKNKDGEQRPAPIKMSRIQCNTCGKIHVREKSYYKKMIKKYDGLFDDHCNTCWFPIRANRPGLKEKGTEGVRRAYRERGDEIKAKISAAIKGTKMGDDNPMRRPEVQAKVSKTRTELMKDPKERAKYRQPSIDAHARGVYIGTKCSQTKWYDYEDRNGEIHKVQGTWELKYIEWLDKNKVKFTCHKGRIPYVDDEGITRNFYPDFYLIDSDEYIDVKGDFWYARSVKKFEYLRKQHPDKKITILRKANLEALGIQIPGTRKNEN